VIAFTVERRGEELGRVQLGIPGRHNVLNALAAIALSDDLGVDFNLVARSLESFAGAKRRFETGYLSSRFRIVDDYGHHPTEIEATLSALREVHPGRRLVALFQPHRYSRVEALFDAFCRAFYAADVVLVLDVYAAGEAPREGVSGERLAEGIRAHGHRAVLHVGRPDAAARRAAEIAAPGDVFVALGAGDVSKAAEALAATLAETGREGRP
jgi:UDP-N-acetylmuramate-alanine ligase